MYTDFKGAEAEKVWDKERPENSLLGY